MTNLLEEKKVSVGEDVLRTLTGAAWLLAEEFAARFENDLSFRSSLIIAVTVFCKYATGPEIFNNDEMLTNLWTHLKRNDSSYASRIFEAQSRNEVPL